MGTVRDLEVWRYSIALARDVYRRTEDWDQRHRYGLADQVRRACVSVPSNIAEGHGRGTPAEFARFLRIARGSVREVETHLVLAEELELGTSETLEPLRVTADRIARMLSGLVDSLTPHS